MNTSIAGLDKAAVLAALYNGSHAQGMGFIHFTPAPMTVDDAAQEIANIPEPDPRSGHRGPKRIYFDYLNGRVMKVDISGDELRTDLYNRDNGVCAAENIIKQLRAQGTGT